MEIRVVIFAELDYSYFFHIKCCIDPAVPFANIKEHVVVFKFLCNTKTILGERY